MVSTTKTAGKANSIKTSATNLDLTVTSEDEFNNLIRGYRDGFQKTAGHFRDEMAELGKNKRIALWTDLAAALSIIEVLKREEYAEWLANVLDETGVPVVLDENTQNVYVMYLRILMGYYPPKPKNWKIGDPEPEFTWSENVWNYASALRGAVKRGLNGKTLYDKLVEEKGLSKCIKADRVRLSMDQEEKDKKERYKTVTERVPPVGDLVAKQFRNAPFETGLVSLFGRFDKDAGTITVLGLFDDSSSSVEKRVEKYADKHAAKVAADLKDAAQKKKDEQLAAKQAELDKREAELATKEATLLKPNERIISVKRQKAKKTGETA